jgi:hypothetical protein
MTTTLRHRVEFVPNPDYVCIHADRFLPFVADVTRMNVEPGYCQECPSEELVESTLALLRAIADIPGVAKAGCHDYHVSVQKGKVFAWDEILPQALQLIADHFGATLAADD